MVLVKNRRKWHRGVLGQLVELCGNWQDRPGQHTQPPRKCNWGKFDQQLIIFGKFSFFIKEIYLYREIWPSTVWFEMYPKVVIVLMPSFTNRPHDHQTFILQLWVFWSNYTPWLLNCPKTIMAVSVTHWWLISLILIVMILMIARESCWCTHCSIVGHKSLCRNWFLSGQLVIVILNICLKSLHGDH